MFGKSLAVSHRWLLIEYSVLISLQKMTCVEGDFGSETECHHMSWQNMLFELNWHRMLQMCIQNTHEVSGCNMKMFDLLHESRRQNTSKCWGLKIKAILRLVRSFFHLSSQIDDHVISQFRNSPASSYHRIGREMSMPLYKPPCFGLVVTDCVLIYRLNERGVCFS